MSHDTDPDHLDIDPVGTAVRAWWEGCAVAGWRPRSGVEQVGIIEAVGRVTADPVYAVWSSPAHELAAMDGIAVLAADTTGAAPDAPIQLLTGAFDIVDTGDPLPPGRDSVIMREDVRFYAGDTVEIVAPVRPGRHVRGVGENVMSGEFLLPAGHRIRPVDAAVAAGAGHVTLAVRSRPIVAVLPTGDEVRPIGSQLRPGEVLDTNSLMLAEMAREAGCTPITMPVTRDDPDELRAAVLGVADRADLILVIAGSSAGRDDHTATVLSALGTVVVQGVAMRPGHPVLLGVVETSVPVPVIGVPGYPVSAAHAFRTFALPLVELVQGVAHGRTTVVEATLAVALTSPRHVEECVQVSLEDRGGPGGLIATPIGRGAGAVSALMRADGLIRVPAGSTGPDAGSEVLVELQAGAPRTTGVGAGEESRNALRTRTPSSARSC